MKHTLRILSAVMALAMILGALVVVPLAANAEEAAAAYTDPLEEKYGIATEGKGITVPESETDKIWDGSTDSVTALAGEGTEANPYKISTAAELMYFRDTVVGGGSAAETASDYYELKDNIYLNAADHESTNHMMSQPVGTFSGVLNGNGYAIYNMYAAGQNKDNKYETAFFHTVSGEIKNLDVVGAFIETHDQCSATLALYLTGTLDNVRVAASTLAWRADTVAFAGGGLVYKAQDGAIIRNCMASGILENCTTTNAKDTVTIAGIVGICTATSAEILVENCVNYASITDNAAYLSPYIGGAGGIVGILLNYKKTITVKNCTNYGALTARSHAGGIVASVKSTNTTPVVIENCRNEGTIAGTAAATRLGGIVGTMSKNSFTMRNCTNTAAITNPQGTQATGGIVGYLEQIQASSFNGCTNSAPITAASAAGGIFGSGIVLHDLTLSLIDCTNTGDITAQSYLDSDGTTVVGGNCAGGLFGLRLMQTNRKDGTIKISNSANSGNITATVSCAGNIAGRYDFGYRSGIVVSGFAANANVTAGTAAGGLYGMANSSHGSNNYSLNSTNIFLNGTISATDATGAAALGVASTNYTTKAISHTTDTTSRFAAVVKENGAVVATPAMTCTSTGVDSAANLTKYPNLLAAYTATDAQSALNTAVLANNLTEDATQQTPWAQTETSPVLVTALGISGATMSLGSNMALNMKLHESALAGIQAMINASDAIIDKTISVAVVDTAGNSVTATNDGIYFTASYAGIRAADMAEEMKLHLSITIAGTEYVSTNILTYSPLTYLTNLYADYTGEKQGEANATKVLNVVTAMLGYGAAAETKDSGATTIAAKMTELEITAPTFTEGYTDHISGVVTEDDKTAINNIAQVGATLTGGMELTFTMKNTAYTALSVADFGVFYADENGKITVTGINAAMIKDTLRLTFTGDGVDGVSANFTVGDFLESRRDNADETALAEATILYMMAARAYVLN